MSYASSAPYILASTDFEALYEQRLNDFLTKWRALRDSRPDLDLPDYDVATLQSHPAAVALQAAAEADVFFRGLLNDVARATLLVTFATGADLDFHGVATRTPSTPNGITRNSDETDTSYRARIIASRAGSSAAGPDEWWLSHILEAHASVNGASFDYRGLGRLTISVVVAEGADVEEVLAAVRARLALDWVRPQGVDVTVVAQ